MVLVHLVEMQDGVGGAEEPLADGGELNPGVRQLLGVRRAGRHGGAQHAAEDLVAEADAAEAHVGS